MLALSVFRMSAVTQFRIRQNKFLKTNREVLEMCLLSKIIQLNL